MSRIKEFPEVERIKTSEELGSLLLKLREAEEFALKKLVRAGGTPLKSRFTEGDLLEEYEERRKTLSTAEWQLEKTERDCFARREASRAKRKAEVETKATPARSPHEMSLTERAKAAKGEAVTPKESADSRSLTEKAKAAKAKENHQ